MIHTFASPSRGFFLACAFLLFGVCSILPGELHARPLTLLTEGHLLQHTQRASSWQGALLHDRLSLGSKRHPNKTPMTDAWEQTVGQPGPGQIQTFDALPIALGAGLAGAALITALIGTMAAVVTKKNLLAWGIVSLVAGVGGLVVGFLVLSVLAFSLPLMIASAAVITVGVVAIMLDVRRKRRRRWRRLYGSKAQQAQDDIVAATSPAFGSTKGTARFAFRF